MRILIDMGHPGHVHFFKNFIWEMEKKGHTVLITARNKEITLDLLLKYHFDFIPVGRQKSGKFNLIKEWVLRDLQILKIAREFHPDFLMGIGNPSVAHVAKLLSKKSLVFTDTEHAKFANGVTFPFADVICTPSCFNYDAGPKQVRYNGYHELAYLHPNRFTPNPAVLTELGLVEDDPFIIVRFVSWQASHDVGQHGIRDKVGLVKALEQYGRVLITSEGALPPELQPYQIRVSPEKLHDLLYYATLYVGEGGTTASEAVMLGTHAIIVSTLSKYCGVRTDLNQYDLLWISESDEYTINKAIELLQNVDLKALGRYNRSRLIAEKIDVTALMVWFIENYPESVDVVKENPDLPNIFRSKRSL
jgi:predicted glycosyltransferase